MKTKRYYEPEDTNFYYGLKCEVFIKYLGWCKVVFNTYDEYIKAKETYGLDEDDFRVKVPMKKVQKIVDSTHKIPPVNINDLDDYRLGILHQYYLSSKRFDKTYNELIESL